jgi:hypothetical protein
MKKRGINMEEFVSDLFNLIGFYVYRLVDPRNDETFYVGRGYGNRVFAHIAEKIDGYKGKSYLKAGDDEVSLKLNLIKEIKDSGLEVIPFIERWGLTIEKEAMLIESTLIDTYKLKRGLSGHCKLDFEHGITNPELLVKYLNTQEYEDHLNDLKYLIIKTDWWRVEDVGRYEATRGNWVIDINKANKYKIVLSVTDQIVQEVYFVDEWSKVLDSNRAQFVGKVASEDIRKEFIGKKIPEVYRKKGMQNPIVYSK